MYVAATERRDPVVTFVFGVQKVLDSYLDLCPGCPDVFGGVHHHES